MKRFSLKDMSNKGFRFENGVLSKQKNTFFKKNKYGAVKQTYDGYSYDSKMEANYAYQLDMRKKAGEIESWQRQHKISLDINGVHIANYFVDFVVYFKDGRKEFHEVKGVETDLWKMKWKITKALYPDFNLVLIK